MQTDPNVIIDENPEVLGPDAKPAREHFNAPAGATGGAAAPKKKGGFAMLFGFLGDVIVDTVMFVPRQAMRAMAVLIPSKRAVYLCLALVAAGTGVYWWAIGFRTTVADPDSYNVGPFRRLSLMGDQRKQVTTVNRLFVPNQSIVWSKGHKYISAPIGNGLYRYEPAD